MFKRILVPLDGSELAERALPAALAIARANAAEVILLRSMVMVHTMLPEFAGEYDWRWPDMSLESAEHEVGEYLESIVQAYRQPNITFLKRILEGDEASAIQDTAHQDEVDLIVMTSHGRSGVKRWLLGSITERTLHTTLCPVLVVRAPETIKHVVIALDGSEVAELALEPGMLAARSLGAHVTLLHVSQPDSGSAQEAIPLEWLERETGRYVMQSTRERAERYLAGIARRYVQQGIEVDTAVPSGSVVDNILSFIENEDVDLVAMSTHARTSLRRWVYGSNTSKVLRGSTCSMLVIRQADSALN
jgi:nucleotide-binding universal stress UspA family protein